MVLSIKTWTRCLSYYLCSCCFLDIISCRCLLGQHRFRKPTYSYLFSFKF